MSLSLGRPRGAHLGRRTGVIMTKPTESDSTHRIAVMQVDDAHVHVWDLDARDQPWIPAASPIRRSFSLADLRAEIADTPIERVVLVQVIDDADETADFLTHAESEDWVAGVVGWADVGAATFGEVLAMLRDRRSLGIRHQALVEPDPAAWLTSPAVQRGLAEHDRRDCPST